MRNASAGCKHRIGAPAFGLLLVLCAQIACAIPVRVEILGIEDPLRANVLAFLTIAKPERTQSLNAEQARRLHARAAAEIDAALMPFGYYSPTVAAQLRPEGEGLVASYRIEPGPATRVARVTIEVTGAGADETAVAHVRNNPPLKAGDPLLQAAYEDYKTRLQQAAYAAGYIDAAYTDSALKIRPEQQEADIVLRLDTGPLYRYGPIRIEQDVLAPDFVARYLDIEPGAPFVTDRLIDLQLKLANTDYFDRVEVRPQREQATDQRIPILIIAEPRKPQRYGASVGYGTDTGPRLGLSAEYRRINRYGHQARADLRLSTVENALSAQYQIPIENVATDRLTFTASLQSDQFEDTRTEQFLLGASRQDDWLFGFRRRLYLNFLDETFDFAGEPGDATLLTPGIGLTRTVGAGALYVTRGYSLGIDLHGALEGVLSDATFLQTLLTGKLVRTLAPQTRLLLRAEVGATEVDDFSKLPPSERFFAGGDRSVRGFGYRELGPLNAQDENTGGQYLLVGSVEIDRIFYQDYGGAVFVDAGNAASSWPDPELAVGVGFRWRSPVGMIRVDLAHALDADANPIRLHVSLGPDL